MGRQPGGGSFLAELWPLTLRIFTHFSLSSQLLLHLCMDLNETWQGCCTTSSLHGFEWNLAGMLHHKSRSACGEIIYVWHILQELQPLKLRIFTHFSLSSQLLHPCMDLNETWQGCCTTSSLHGFEWNLARMLHHKSKSAFGEIIYVRQISQELQPLTLRIFAHFSLSFSTQQLLLHLCMDLNETWQGCCTTSLEVLVGRLFMFGKFCKSYGPWHLEFLHILACLLNSSYIFAWIWMKLGRDVVLQV